MELYKTIYYNANDDQFEEFLWDDNHYRAEERNKERAKHLINFGWKYHATVWVDKKKFQNPQKETFFTA